MRVSLRFAIVSALALTVHASAENRVCIGGDLDHLTAVQKSACSQLADQVRTSAATFHAPEDWHFFILCGENDWNLYASFSGRTGSDLAAFVADTNIENHTTFLSGEQLRTSGADGIRRLVAHEVAMATLQTTDEDVLQLQIASWLPEVKPTEPQAPILVATAPAPSEPAPVLTASN